MLQELSWERKDGRNPLPWPNLDKSHPFLARPGPTLLFDNPRTTPPASFH